MITTIKNLWFWLNEPALELRIRLGKAPRATKAHQIPPGIFIDRNGTIHVIGIGRKETK